MFCEKNRRVPGALHVLNRAGLLMVTGALPLMGCAAHEVDFSTITQPARAGELDAFDAFVGSWTWEAEVVNATGEGKCWTGTAEWRWSLDRRCLVGDLHARSNLAGFDATGLWTFNPKTRRYVWTMFNSWGYPQSGTAKYDDSTRTWTMRYRCVGLDGTGSYGRYTMKVVDADTLEWRQREWADPMYLILKMELRGTYKRRR